MEPSDDFESNQRPSDPQSTASVPPQFSPATDEPPPDAYGYAPRSHIPAPISPFEMGARSATSIPLAAAALTDPLSTPIPTETPASDHEFPGTHAAVAVVDAAAESKLAGIDVMVLFDWVLEASNIAVTQFRRGFIDAPIGVVKEKLSFVAIQHVFRPIGRIPTSVWKFLVEKIRGEHGIDSGPPV